MDEGRDHAVVRELEGHGATTREVRTALSMAVIFMA